MSLRRRSASALRLKRRNVHSIRPRISRAAATTEASCNARARRALAKTLASVVAAALLILGLMLWTFRRLSRNALAERRRSDITAQLTRALADAYTPGEVSHAL